MSINRTHTLSIVSLNVCGLRTKLEYDDFQELIKSNDIICLQEIKTDSLDHEYIKMKMKKLGYHAEIKSRQQISNVRSGGLCIIYKENLTKHCNYQHCEDNRYMQMLKVDKNLTGYEKDLWIVNVYIPPEGNTYVDDNCFNEIAQTMLKVCHSNWVLLNGDFNSHIGLMDDYVDLDDFILDQIGIDENTRQMLEDQGNLELLGVERQRNSVDSKPYKKHGHMLIEFCKMCSVVVLNGRMGLDRYQGKGTTKDGDSVIDYMIGSVPLLRYVMMFTVDDFDPIFSDRHAILKCKLSLETNNIVHEYTDNESDDNTIVQQDHCNYMPWVNEKRNDYIKNIDLQLVQNIKQKLNGNDTDVEEICNDIKHVMISSAQKSFPKGRHTGIRKTKSKPFYNAECDMHRKRYMNAKNRHRKFKSNQSRNEVISTSKLYKQALNKAKVEHKRKLRKEIRVLKSSNTKKYWQMLNGNAQRKKVGIPIHELFQHYSILGGKKENEVKPNDADINISEEAMNVLNCPFTEDEILKNVKLLKSGKATGRDKIKNEYISSTFHIFKEIYISLFNKILDEGFMPEEWLIGLIMPIPKSGDPRNPDNTRGITLLSCMGKLFTSLLNSRLVRFAEIVKLINENQTGFRPGYGTIDHIFLLRCLIDIYFSKNRKLYCAFIDYKKAFDTIWRAGLWIKMVNNGIRGKIFNVIFNMYQNIKSQVVNNNESSEFFNSYIGVRQGENLSPFLFALFVNDLEDFFIQHNSKYLEVDEQINGYIKILVLLYADDTVILADSPVELQRCLDSLKLYCNEWRLTVNEKKTKICIFSKRKSNINFQFSYDGKPLEIVDSFKYLGVTFYRTGKFSVNINNLRDQAQKAMFALLAKGRELSLPIDILLDYFDKTVVPIMLYGSEIWGYENLSMIEKLHLKFCKYITKVKNSTVTNIVMGELGRFPLDILVKSRMVKYWSKLVNSEKDKLCVIMYRHFYIMYSAGRVKSKWLDTIKSTLIQTGQPAIWRNQSQADPNFLSNNTRNVLKDQFIANWRSELEDPMNVNFKSKCYLYKG